MTGILEWKIHDTPITVIDFETTGLKPGPDRVVEVSVYRREPGQSPHLVLDTLVNPGQKVAATKIHGITDADVEHAPLFKDIAGDLVSALSGSVVSAYNVYFDLRFLTYELKQVGVEWIPPHFCLMYLRPMLGLGKTCKLEEACKEYQIEHEHSHIASSDAHASGKLLEFYLNQLQVQNIETFAQLSRLKTYKFIQSWTEDPLPNPKAFQLEKTSRFVSRLQTVPEQPSVPVEIAPKPAKKQAVDPIILLGILKNRAYRLKNHGRRVSLHS